MLTDAKLVAFSATTDPRRAIAFYRDTLGLTFVEESPFAVVFDAHGTELRVQIVGEVVRPPYTTLGWSVADIAAAARDFALRGVTMERFPGLAQDDLGVWHAPSGTKVAWFRDPDGNLLSLAQHPA